MACFSQYISILPVHPFDRAKRLAVEAQVLLKVEGKERSGSGHQSNQLILNTLPFFKLNAQFAVETDNLQVTQNLEAFARYRDTPQTFWQECESSEGMSTSACCSTLIPVHSGNVYRIRAIAQ